MGTAWCGGKVSDALGSSSTERGRWGATEKRGNGGTG